jgi:osmotically-inducible protein OsmY
MASDDDIRQKIIDRLAQDRRLEAAEIEVEVDQRRVKLIGSVPHLPALFRAVTQAQQTPGVVGVEDDVKVVPPESIDMPSDAELLKEATDTIHFNSSLGQADIQISGRDGRLVLEGRVDSLWKKEYAGEIIRLLPGVTSLENRLIIAPSTPKDDTVIAKEVEKVLNDLGVSESVAVKVKDGAVTLSGTLPTAQSSQAVLKGVVNEVEGLVAVQDELTVGPEKG